MYKRSSEFEGAVEAELISLRLEAPHAPAELLRAKMMRDGVRATRRAVFAEAARRLADDPTLERMPIGIFAKARSASEPMPAPRPRAPEAAKPIPDVPVAAAAPVIRPIDLSHLREEFRTEALSGEHRVGVATQGGRDTLTEALQLMAQAGLLSVEVQTDDEGYPVLVYRPVSPLDRLPSF